MTERGRQPTVFNLIYSLKIGGAETLIAALGAALVEQARFRPFVCAWRQGGPYEAHLREARVETRVLGLPRRRAWTGPMMLVDLGRILTTLTAVARAENARIVHTHLMDSAVLGAVVAHRLGCPLVSTVYSNHLIPTGFARGGAGFRIWRRLYRWALARCQQVIAVSPMVRDTLVHELGLEPSRIEVMHVGVTAVSPSSPAAVAEVRKSLGVPMNTPMLVFVGRFVSSKNQIGLIRMMPLLLSRNPEVRLVLVGEGPELPACRAEVERCGLGGRVILTGRHPDARAVVGAADVFVTASTTEGVSLALLEAMQAEVAVVAAACEGNDEVLSDGAGVLVVGDAAALAAAVADLLDDAEQRRTVARAGRTRALQRYDFAASARQLEAIYHRLLDTAGDSAGAVAHLRVPS